jgi:hypothetical protein
VSTEQASISIEKKLYTLDQLLHLETIETSRVLRLQKKGMLMMSEEDIALAQMRLLRAQKLRARIENALTTTG